MKNNYFAALVVQAVGVVIGLVHSKITPLGSTFMFGVLLLALAVGTYLLWNALRNPKIPPMQRRLGLLLGSLPFGVLLSTLLYVGTTKM